MNYYCRIIQMDITSTASTKDTAGGSSDTASTSYHPCGYRHMFSMVKKNVCSFHYQGFVDSMKELLLLKERCYDIKARNLDAMFIDSQVQEASEDISKKNLEIVKYRLLHNEGIMKIFNNHKLLDIYKLHRKLMKNASTAIDQISVCLPVLENYAKLQELMQHKKYYQALKVLEELEHTHLALVEKYRFTQILAKSMGPVRSEIKNKAYSEFKDFLENIKKVACRIGRHASRCTAEQHSFGVSEMERTRRLQQEAKQMTKNSLHKILSISHPFTGIYLFLYIHVFNSLKTIF
uniref:Vps54_N domain-containing protein n=1 Tax=Heterorhabditis bacteriophora TaxID=37862 RepID=A0A1I7X919_HETBA